MNIPATLNTALFGIGLNTYWPQFSGLEQIALVNQLQPVGNVVVNRTFPFAVRITAMQAASSLHCG